MPGLGMSGHTSPINIVSSNSNTFSSIPEDEELKASAEGCLAAGQSPS